MEWFIMSDGIQYGPISFESVKKIADDDKLRSSDFIRRSDSEEWLKVTDVIALKNCMTNVIVTKTYLFPEGSLAWTWFQIVFPTVGIVVACLQLFQIYNGFRYK
jgi:hypothetical protein